MTSDRIRPSHWILLFVAAVVSGVLALGYVTQWQGHTGSSGQTTSNPPQSAAALTIPQTMAVADDARLNAVIQLVDPANDLGWDTEVLAAGAKHQLDRMASMLSSPATTITAQSVSEFSVASVTSSHLRPQELTKVFSDGRTEVWRVSRRSPESDGPVSTSLRAGHDGLARSLNELSQPMLDASDIRITCKVIGVNPRTEGFDTTALFEGSGQLGGGGRIQQNAKWVCRWRRTTDASQPMLEAIVLADFEEIRPINSAGIQFVDRTNAIMGQTTSYHQQLWSGIDYWSSRLEMNYGIDPNGNQGIALGDVNGDGLEDVYVCQQGGLPNRLYIRNADGSTLRDASAEAGVDWMELTRSALLIDVDNDGDQDLVLCQGWYLLVMTNSGRGRFELTSQHRCQGDAYSMAAADYDNDADLDIFVCGRDPDPTNKESAGILGSPLPYHDANNGAPNMLWRNDGSGSFRDVTEEVGLNENNMRFSYAAAWADYDNDGDQDLYVANDFGRNNLYQNNGGRFTDLAAKLGVEDISAGMSATWGDCDRDGLLDLYVSNMFSSAGNRIAYQRQFRPGASPDALADFQRHARGNSLFRNAGDDGFQDVSSSSGVTMGRWAWGAKFADLNNDSREDIYVANGFITTEDTGDL